MKLGLMPVAIVSSFIVSAAAGAVYAAGAHMHVQPLAESHRVRAVAPDEGEGKAWGKTYPCEDHFNVEAPASAPAPVKAAPKAAPVKVHPEKHPVWTCAPRYLQGRPGGPGREAYGKVEECRWTVGA